MTSTQNNQEMVSLQVSLPQMLDLALGTPEVGAVNLNILHNFLHILLHQINLKNTTVEYRGENAARIKNIVDCSKPATSLLLQEYQITDGTGQVYHREHDTTIQADIISPDSKTQSARVSSTPHDGGKASKGVKQKISPGGAGEGQSVIFVEAITDGVVPTALAFKRLEDSVIKLERQFEALEELANTPEIIERMKGLRTEPLSDMWHVININKRLDATEEGMTKIMEMVQDLMKSDKIEIVGTDSSQQFERINNRLSEVETNLSHIVEDISNFRGAYQSGPVNTTQKVHQTKVIPVEPIVSPDPSVVMSKSGSKTLQVEKLPSPEKSSSKVKQKAAKKQKSSSVDEPSSVIENPPKEEERPMSNSADVPPENIENSPAQPEKSPSISSAEEIPSKSEKSPIKSSSESDGALPTEAAPSREKLKSLTESPGNKTVSSSNVTASKSTSGPNRRSLSNNVELTALRDDINEVRSDLSQTKQNVKQVQSQVNELERVISYSSTTVINHNEDGTPGATATPRKDQLHGHSTEHASISNHDESDLHSAEQSPQASHPEHHAGGTRASTSRKNRSSSIASIHDAILSPKKKHLKPRTFEKSPSDDDVDKIRMMEALRNIEIMYGEAIQNLDARLMEMDQEVTVLNDKIRGIPCGPEGVREMQDMMMKIRKQQSYIEEMSRAPSPMQNANETQRNEEPAIDVIQEIQEMVGKIQKIQADIEHINQTAARLAEEKFNREMDTNAILEQIELLKTVKADREDLEDALADKADAKVVKRKVSYDQFDTTCDDLAHGLEDAVSKLTQQETIWQQALEEVQREIDGKLDKFELGPIKDFVNNRLRLLQDKLKKLAEQRREREAAGTKKMLSDVQCISCDKNVVMQTEEGINYRADPMPYNRTIKPYLAYELDQVRRQQKKLPSRNMIQFNAAVKDMGRRAKLTREENIDGTSKYHLCNRYCGGSHTITTPHQRVLRMGHFLAQWGPEAVQLSDGPIKGTDGQLYRGRPMPPSQSAKRSGSSSPRGQTESEGERPAIPQQNARSVSLQKSQMSQRKSSGLTLPASKRNSRKTVESIKEIRPHTEPISEEPHPSPRSELEIPQEAEISIAAASPESPTNDDEYNGGDEMD